MNFSDYFELPQEFDTGPYTATTLAKLKTEVFDSFLSHLRQEVTSQDTNFHV